jgi:hypothetical protein
VDSISPDSFTQNDLTSPTSSTYTLLSTEQSSADPNLIHRFDWDDPCRLLSAGSNVAVSYNVRATLDNPDEAPVSSALGNLLADWLPSSLNLPEDNGSCNSKLLGGINGHGPLALDSPATIRFRGPTCLINKVPFRVERLDIEPDISVGSPFEINFRIFNSTDLNQTLHVALGGVPSFNDNGLIITGLLAGDMNIGPLKNLIVSYTVLATRPGEIVLPAIKVASERYKTLVIDSDRTLRRIFVLP